MAVSRRVTIEDIGLRLKVSTSTVSRALRQDPLIHPETRARINSLAADLGYQGRARQSPTRGGILRTISVIFPESGFSPSRRGTITTAYLQGLSEEAERAEVGLSLLSFPTSNGDAAADGVPRNLHSSGSDAIILVGHHRAEAVRLLGQSMPVVSLVWHYPDILHDVVTTGDECGMSMLVRELVSLGHRRLAWVGTYLTGCFADSRKAAFIYACLSNGLPPLEQYFFDRDPFCEAMSVDVARLQAAMESGVTGFVCACDHAADLVIRALEDAGVRVPEDASVTGFDHSAPASADVERITTIDPNFVQMGRTAIRLAKWRLEQPSACSVQLSLPPEFIEGRSTGRSPHLLRSCA